MGSIDETVVPGSRKEAALQEVVDLVVLQAERFPDLGMD